MNHDPYEVLGVDPSASAEELAAARRRRARELHPDLGGSDAAMQELNAAYDEAVRRSTAPPVEADTDPVVAERGDGRRPRGTQHGRVRIDHPSFTLDVLPVEAYEALLVVTSWMGEVLVDEPPYLLEVFLHDPAPCWCRLDLVPDAGGTTVSLVVAGVDGAAVPDTDDVRDVWVANLNRL